jgi:hypothetical protein
MRLAGSSAAAIVADQQRSKPQTIQTEYARGSVEWFEAQKRKS